MLLPSGNRAEQLKTPRSWYPHLQSVHATRVQQREIIFIRCYLLSHVITIYSTITIYKLRKLLILIASSPEVLTICPSQNRREVWNKLGAQAFILPLWSFNPVSIQLLLWNVLLGHGRNMEKLRWGKLRQYHLKEKLLWTGCIWH